MPCKIFTFFLLFAQLAFASYIQSTAGAGTGDVVGPASAIDGSVVVFSGTTGKIVAGTTYLRASNGSTRTKLFGDTIEIHNAAETGQYLYIADRQLTMVGRNLYFEDMDHGGGSGSGSFGDMWWETHDNAEIGYSDRECIEEARCVGAPKRLWLGTGISWDKNGDGTHNGKLDCVAPGVCTWTADRMTINSNNANYYWDTILDVSSLHLVSTNIDIRLNGSTLRFVTAGGSGDGADIGTASADRPTNVFVKTKVQTDGNFVANVAGGGLKVKEGSNAKMGTATLVDGAATVSNTSVTATSRILLTCNDPNGGTPGFLHVSARTAATSFVITSSSATDTCIVAYHMIEPA